MNDLRRKKPLHRMRGGISLTESIKPLQRAVNAIKGTYSKPIKSTKKEKK